MLFQNGRIRRITNMKKIKEYFKNTDKSQIMQDAYAVVFFASGFASLIFLTYKFVKWKF